MTERLATLLREEANHLDVPAPPAPDILASGRRLRRRRSAFQAAGASLLAAIVVTGVVAASSLSDDDRHAGSQEVDPATAAYLDHGAFATGTTIHLGNGGNVDIGEKVKVLYYTSAGLLVRSGETPWTDDPGPSHYSLVAPDGAISRLDLDLGDRVPATDPDQQVMAYADAAGAGHWDVVVRDVTTGEELSRTTVDGTFTWGGWEAPPVDLDGDLVYVGLDDDIVTVDWHTGEVATTSLGGSSTPSVAGGYVVRTEKRSVDIVDLASGKIVYSTSRKGYPYVTLSPDGRFAKVVLQDDSEGSEFTTVDLSARDTTTIHQSAWDFGWTPAGNLISVDLKARELTTCTPDTGECSHSTVSGPVDGDLKLAGNAYES